MPLNAKTLRRTLLALAVLLVVAVGGVIGYKQWRKLKLLRDIQAILKRGIGHQLCDNCSWSQNVKGHLAFRIHAKNSVETAPGKFTLHDAQITLFSPDGKREDNIYGAEFEYDQKNEIVRSEGEVQMDLQAPESMTRKPSAGSSPAPAKPPIHVRTSGLVYMRKLDVAATDKPVEIHYAGLICTAVGADLDNNTDVVRLLHDVHVTGSLQGRAGTLDAENAALNRDTNQLDLARPRAVSADRRAQAQHALVYLRKDGSVDHGSAEGSVELTSIVPGGSRVVDAPRLEVTANQDNVVQTARLLGGVTLTGTDPAKPMHGQAQTADLRFNKAGRLEDLVADGHASLHTEDQANGHVLRDLRGDRIHASFLTPANPANPKAQTILSAMETHGAAVMRIDQPIEVEGQTGPARRTSEMRGDDLRTTFAPETVAGRETASLRTVDVHGHTTLDQQDTTGARSSSTGDQLQATFAGGDPGRGVELLSAVQTGHVQMAGLTVPKPAAGKPAKAPEPWRGSAGRAVFDGRTEVLTLTAEGDSAVAHVEDPQSQIDAQEVRLHRLTGDGEAAGEVRATLAGNPDAPDKLGQPTASAQLTHVEADRARMIRSLDQAEFTGSAAHPARLWQQASRVEAAHLLVDRDRKTLVARPEGSNDWVRADFADAGSATPKPQTVASSGGSRGSSPFGGKRAKTPEVQPGLPQAGGALRVVAARMDYSDISRQALFSGGPRGRLQMQFAGGDSTADRGVVFLSPAKMAQSGSASAGSSNLGSSLERAVLLGAVELRQPERTATSDQLTYMAAENLYTLSANPGKTVHIDDRRQGNVTGSMLTFSNADGSIVVAGEPGASRQRGGRVRTELELKP